MFNFKAKKESPLTVVGLEFDNIKTVEYHRKYDNQRITTTNGTVLVVYKVNDVYVLRDITNSMLTKKLVKLALKMHAENSALWPENVYPAIYSGVSVQGLTDGLIKAGLTVAESSNESCYA